MEVIAFLLLVLFIGIAILVNAFYRRGKQQKAEQSYIMDELGIQPEMQEALRPLVAHLQQAFESSYVEQVRERVVREHQISLIEWENRWFEWQRFLVLVALFRHVPMYSREIDEIWHEMLAFKDEYEQFCQRYLKTSLEHAPKLPGSGFDEKEKAQFDWYYVTLFQPTPYSHRIWGRFLKYPLERKVVDDFCNRTTAELQADYANQEVAEKLSLVEKSASQVIDHLRKQMSEIDQYVKKNGSALDRFVERVLQPLADKQSDEQVLKGYLFLSFCYADEFSSQRERLTKQISPLKWQKTS